MRGSEGKNGYAKKATSRTPVRQRSAPAQRFNRSAVTNGSRLFVVSPGDTRWHRRFRDVLDQIIADISGPDGLSEGQRQLARRAATISIACEKLECVAATGADIDLEQYGQLTDRLGRAFHRLGLKRQPRDVTDPLAYAKQLDGEAAT
jgi:hypothetical protein